MMSTGCGSSYGFEIRPDVLLESREDVAVDVVARDELAVVEPLAIVEDEFDAVYEDGLRVLVDGHFQFGAYALQRVGVRPFGPDFIEVGMGGLGQQSGGFGRPK